MIAKLWEQSSDTVKRVSLFTFTSIYAIISGVQKESPIHEKTGANAKSNLQSNVHRTKSTQLTLFFDNGVATSVL
jgi:hypothetical protein